jgi:hypothetical protein
MDVPRKDLRQMVEGKYSAFLEFGQEFTNMRSQIDGFNEPPKSLSYTEDFQFAQTAWDVVSPPHPLARTMDIDWDDMFQAYNRRSWKGFFCTKCGRLSCRIHWDRFECANKDCKFTIVPKKRGAFTPEQLADPYIPIFTSKIFGSPASAGIFSKTVGRSTHPHIHLQDLRIAGFGRYFFPKQLADPHIPRFTGPATPYDIVKNEETVKLVTATRIDEYTVRQYKLGDEGMVTHMLANLPINARECGADWLLKEYQNADIPFLRYPMHTVQGVTRTAHYT